jgi:2-oxoisovalerate dehydrogenase E1 component
MPSDFYLEKLKKAVLIRTIEEELLALYKQGRLYGTVHTCIGQELNPIAISNELISDDTICSNHRGHGHYIARTGDVRGCFAEILGKTTGCSRGVGGSQHFNSKNYFSNGVQGGMVPVAAGLALTHKFKNNSAISVAYIGDGSFGEGVLYETLNITSLWELPLLLVVENNGIAQSTSIKQNLSGSIKGRASAFNIKYLHANSWSLDELFAASKEATRYVRDNQRPLVLELASSRLHAHSKGDDNRSDVEINALWEKDPISVFSKKSPSEYQSFLAEAKLFIRQCLEDIEGDEPLNEAISEVTSSSSSPNFVKLLSARELTLGNASLYSCFKDLLKLNNKIFMMGEDIETANSFNPKEYGGAFKVTRDLSELYPGRVVNTPISEAAIVGIGAGMCLGGYKPIVEIMFGDFITLAFDQILQHASKFRAMYGGEIEVPLIIRTPMGGKRGYGPTHSQSLEKHFLGISGLDVVALNNRINPKIIYNFISTEGKTPFLIIENKTVYTKPINQSDIAGYDIYISDEKLPTIKFTPSGSKADCTIVCYGGMLLEVEASLPKLFDEFEILCEVICPSLISKIQADPIVESIINTKKLIILEEGSTFAAWGSEVIALLAKENALNGVSVQRVGNDSIIPSAFLAEKNLLCNSEKIIEVVRGVINGR